MSTLNATFEDAIRVTPEGANKYSANLRPEWCIGAGIYIHTHLPQPQAKPKQPLLTTTQFPMAAIQALFYTG